VRAVLGPDLKLVQSMALLKAPGTSEKRWHQDQGALWLSALATYYLAVVINHHYPPHRSPLTAHRSLHLANACTSPTPLPQRLHALNACTSPTPAPQRLHAANTCILPTPALHAATTGVFRLHHEEKGASCVLGWWIALDDADQSNGCMHFHPGSHKGGVVPHGLPVPPGR
jgi:ectoine hydroxylase-related dioxygenase (phytanoyl-CoA dioxygenase family)